MVKEIVMSGIFDIVPNEIDEFKPHKKCGGYSEWTPNGVEYDCHYQSSLSCEDCKYGLGTKDPEAKCNK